MDFNIGEIIIGLITAILLVLKYKDETKKKKLEIENLRLRNENLDVKQKLQYLDRVMDLSFVNEVSNAVERIFDSTKADRFLLLIARNGLTDFKIVNVVFEQHKNKEYRINAIARYRNVEVDDDYRQMLKRSEIEGVIHLETATMPNCILKSFYEMEGVTFSKIRHLARMPIDSGNDFLIYSSISTHEPTDFTNNELAFIKTQYEGAIKPALSKVLD